MFLKDLEAARPSAIIDIIHSGEMFEVKEEVKKTQKALPAFGWDTDPVVGAEEVIEEAFIDVFCDLVYGGGWMDVERIEDVDRECNWALVRNHAFLMRAHGEPCLTASTSLPLRAGRVQVDAVHKVEFDLWHGRSEDSVDAHPL